MAGLYLHPLKLKIVKTGALRVVSENPTFTLLNVIWFSADSPLLYL
jgi:hypothetical protein